MIRKLCWSGLPLLVAGCLHPVAQTTDQTVREMGSLSIDRLPSGLPAQPHAGPAPDQTPASLVETPSLSLAPVDSTLSPVSYRDVQQERNATANQGQEKLPKGVKRLQVPAELPGAGAPRMVLPPTTAPPKEREAALNKLFPPLPPLPTLTEPVPGPNGDPLTLADLQRLALNHSPVIRQATADVEAARGVMIQAGLYPNPSFGWAQDEVGTGGHSPAELGVFLGQTFVTGGKLTLARAMGKADLQIAEATLKRAQADLAGQVRANYFAVLVARKNLQVARALARFTDEIYRVQVDQVKLAQAAAYEPRQMRVFALQARNTLWAARNRDMSAWNQLVATLGLAKMPPTELAGSVDMPVPVYRYDAALARILRTHTDVAIAGFMNHKARLGVQRARAQVTPDVTLNMHMNKLFPESGFVHSLDVQFPVPLYDRNQGGIMQAQAYLVRAVEEPRRVQSDLTTRLADAFERYNANRQILEEYKNHILTDQVEAYLGAFERHQQEPDKVTFGDVVAAQQVLASTITSYVSTLGNLWQAVADMSTLLQTNDLFQADESEQWPRIPDLDPVVPLPINSRPLQPIPTSPAAARFGPASAS